MITVEMLERKRACNDGLKLFKELYPNGVEPTLEVCLLVAQKFGWNWAAKNLLPAPARKRYYEATDQASKLHDEKANGPARKLYNEAKARAFANAYQKETKK